MTRLEHLRLFLENLGPFGAFLLCAAVAVALSEALNFAVDWLDRKRKGR